MQPYLFPYIGYYQLLHAVDRFVVADDVAFIKQGWINRNRLLINGSAAYFTVPVRRHAADALIRDVEIDDLHKPRWRVTVLKTIANFYRRAPSFDRVYPLVERVIGGPFTSDRRGTHAGEASDTSTP
jgi:WbqC-like protein